MNSHFRLLRLLLTIGGCILLSASVPVFFSPAFMARLHRELGLGEFPVQPIAVYLAKSVSLLYALHGAVMLFVAMQFERFKDLVPLLGWLHVALGATLIYIDLAAGMPWWWLANEGPPVMAVGLLFVFLYRKAARKELLNR